MRNVRIVYCLSLVMALSSATGFGQAQESEQLEKCFGITLSGENDGMASGENENVPASSELNYDGQAWKFVIKGTCVEIQTPFGAGSLKALDDRPPK